VPRSQVYGAADDLEDRGLLDVQQTTPKRYRAVSLEGAREQLRREFEREQEQAFDALAEIEPDFADGDEPQETIWTVRGREGIDARIESFHNLRSCRKTVHASPLGLSAVTSQGMTVLIERSRTRSKNVR